MRGKFRVFEKNDEKSLLIIMLLPVLLASHCSLVQFGRLESRFGGGSSQLDCHSVAITNGLC